jgi:Fe-S-cluster-containing dehydrogenase component
MNAANPAERVVRKCELCGKVFEVGRMKQQRFCSTVCNRRAYRIKHGAVSRTVAVFDRAQLRRQKLMQEVIDAQRGPIEELYEKSKKWNKEQRDFAKARYMKIHFGK